MVLDDDARIMSGSMHCSSFFPEISAAYLACWSDLQPDYHMFGERRHSQLFQHQAAGSRPLEVTVKNGIFRPTCTFLTLLHETTYKLQPAKSCFSSAIGTDLILSFSSKKTDSLVE